MSPLDVAHLVVVIGRWSPGDGTAVAARDLLPVTTMCSHRNRARCRVGAVGGRSARSHRTESALGLAWAKRTGDLHAEQRCGPARWRALRPGNGRFVVAATSSGRTVESCENGRRPRPGGSACDRSSGRCSPASWIGRRLAGLTAATRRPPSAQATKKLRHCPWLLAGAEVYAKPPES